jgi:hypothetical protein
LALLGTAENSECDAHFDCRKKEYRSWGI